MSRGRITKDLQSWLPSQLEASPKINQSESDLSRLQASSNDKVSPWQNLDLLLKGKK